MQQKHTILGSEHSPTNKINCLGKLEDKHLISTTWVLSKSSLKYINDIKSYCQSRGLRTFPGFRYNLQVIGTARDFNNALSIDLRKYQDGNHVYHASSTPIQIPMKWSKSIRYILGLNTSKIFEPSIQISNTDASFTPPQIASLYGFPNDLDGSGQKIGIIELAGGYKLSDIKQYLFNIGVRGVPDIKDISIDGARNDPDDQSTASYEVAMHIEVLASLVPASKINVYFAPSTIKGYYDALATAIADQCNIILMPWGSSEATWTKYNMEAFNYLLDYAVFNNIVLIAASGNGGNLDGTVYFPASSPNVLACGGTSLTTNGNIITNEVTWSGSGGGVSNTFKTPMYQSKLPFNLQGYRGVPDVSGHADPKTGYKLFSNGKTFIAAGTGAVSSLWGSLIAKINQKLGRPYGFFHPILYSNPTGFIDITQGSNGNYSAAIGWDPCTGNGSPKGQQLLSIITGATNTPSTKINNNFSTGVIEVPSAKIADNLATGVIEAKFTHNLSTGE